MLDLYRELHYISVFSESIFILGLPLVAQIGRGLCILLPLSVYGG